MATQFPFGEQEQSLEKPNKQRLVISRTQKPKTLRIIIRNTKKADEEEEDKYKGHDPDFCDGYEDNYEDFYNYGEVPAHESDSSSDFGSSKPSGKNLRKKTTAGRAANVPAQILNTNSTVPPGLRFCNTCRNGRMKGGFAGGRTAPIR